jgi:hypothetical protein
MGRKKTAADIPPPKKEESKAPPTMTESAGKGLTGGTRPEDRKGVPAEAKKKGGAIKKYARGGGIESRGKTRGKMC